ncbi:DUF3147 family protein [Aurantiacibacter luteus]|uniref:Peptide ABC transporter permease n=1 Tax=Aurantiacibacter luteus TaxID=1581420 RepID=A0A0G9MWI7_9SPHN|nr:DUF3147 family protein [Aurantiacibacter luteus]KLE35090.1 peptide ABC transporter permease [Aurantiacibacter luteus]
MLYLFIKAALSGIVIAVASEVARRWPGIGALIVALPLVSVLAMIWLWRDSQEVERVAALSGTTFWFILPSLPMFLVIPWLLRSGVGFWAALALGCALTTLLYLGMIWLGPRFGLRL